MPIRGTRFHYALGRKRARTPRKRAKELQILRAKNTRRISTLAERAKAKRQRRGLSWLRRHAVYQSEHRNTLRRRKLVASLTAPDPILDGLLQRDGENAANLTKSGDSATI